MNGAQSTASRKELEISVLRWAPPVVQGLVRDLRVRWALEEAGWSYREHVIDPKEQKSDGYRRERQPFGQIPAFRRSDGMTLFESGGIVHHIAMESPALMPTEPQERAQVTSWMFSALDSVEPPCSMLTIMDIVYQGPKGDDVQAMRAWVRDWVESRLDALVHVLEDGSGDYVLLGRFTAADLLLTTVLRELRHTDLVKTRPKLDAYQQRCEARPAFKKALADHMANFAKHTP